MRIIFSILVTIFAVDGVTVERALVLVASEKGLAYWAYKWIHSPSGHCRTTSINIKVYKSVHMYTHIHGIQAYWAYKWIHSPCCFRLATVVQQVKTYKYTWYTGILGIQVNSLTKWPLSYNEYKHKSIQNTTHEHKHIYVYFTQYTWHTNGLTE